MLPAAAHLTAASLSSVHPTETYTESSIITLAYGRLPDGGIALGSWDLMDAQRRFEILAITAKAAQGTGEATLEPWSSLPHNGFDLVIMNPPFTRPTGHESEKIGVRNPMFAAFRTDDETQKLMGKAAAKLSSGTNYHGNAGEASLFLALAHRKLKAGGTLAMVLPLSFMLGDSWAESRSLVARNYADLILVTNAGLGGADVSFSSDTDMGECLLVGVKKECGADRATFVTLNERPDTTMSGTNIAVQIQHAIKSGRLRKLEDGPVGGSPIMLGSELVGQAIGAPLPAGWNLARVRDFTLAQTVHGLVGGRLLFPGMPKSNATDLAMTTVGAIGAVGPYHADINGLTAKGGIRGPFDKRTIQPGSVPTYPVLWEHEAERERTICFEAEAECVPRVGRDEGEQKAIDVKIDNLWATASHCHFNRDFRFNSQSTAMQFSQACSLGGRAWLSIKLRTRRQEKALALWGNTTLGILLYWWFANKQQPGRGSIGKSALGSFVILDVTALSNAQLESAESLFDELSCRSLQTIDRLASDEARAALDQLFLTNCLRLPEDWHEEGGVVDLLRRKLASEPSIIGGKRTRPVSAAQSPGQTTSQHSA